MQINIQCRLEIKAVIKISFRQMVVWLIRVLFVVQGF